MSTYTARCVRSGRWWAIDVPELPGVHTQARRLDRAHLLAREAIALYLDVPEHSIEVELSLELDEAIRDELAAADDARRDAAAAQVRAADVTAALARDLVRQRGLSLRDAGIVMGLSHQRVEQLVKSIGPAPG